MIDIAARVPLTAFTVLALPGSVEGNGLPLAFLAKHTCPDRAYIYGAWNHLAHLSHQPVDAESLGAQIGELVAAGIDGWKILESKPDLRRDIGEALDGPYYAPAFATLAKLDLPLLWHVADPEEFWDPALIPAWAKIHHWGYDERFPSKESLYAEVERVLNRHPRLRVVFAHFYFMSADLDRASRFLAAHPTVGFDLAPGVELLYNLSRNRDRARDFLIRHADRIYFGTDAGLLPRLPIDSVEMRIGLVQRFLATGDTFRIPPNADALLGEPAAGIIHGLELPAGVLDRIFVANQRERVGARPKPLDAIAAALICRRMAATWRDAGGDGDVALEAERIASLLTQNIQDEKMVVVPRW